MRSKKAFKNILASALYQVVTIICGLITPRLILSNFGSTYNGVVTSATQFLHVISILTLGITGATRLALYKPLSQNDTLGVSRIMKATKKYMRKVALCVIAYAVILSIIYPFISHNELTHLENATLIAIVSMGTFAQYFFGISNQMLLQADQSSYVIYALDIFKTIVNTIFVAIFIKLGGSIYIVKLASSVIFFITPVILNMYVKKKYKLISKCEPSNKGLEQRGAVAVHSIANMVHDNAPLIVLTLFTDAKLISVYTVYCLVVGKIKSLLQIVTTGIEAAFGNMWVKNEKDVLKKNFLGFEFLIFTFVTVVFSCVGILILPFISRYTSGITDIQYVRLDLAFLMTMAEAVFCIRQPYVILVYATGNYRKTRNGAIAESVLNILVSLSLVGFIGINGVVIGTLVANAFRTIQYVIFTSKNILERSISSVIKRALLCILNITVICFVSNIILSNILFSSGWIGWIMQGIIVFVLSVGITFVTSFIFYRDDMNIITALLKRILKKDS